MSIGKGLSVGAILTSLGMTTKGWDAGVKKYFADQKKMRKEADKTGKKVEGMSKKYKKGLMIVSAALLVSVGASIKFNKQMANIATLMPESTEKVVALKTEIQRLAIATGKSTDDVSDGAYNVASAFGEAEIEGAKLGITVRTAAAGMSTTKEALDLLAASTKGYGDTSDTAFQHAADLAFTTVRLGQTTFPELAASIGKTIPIAAKMNVPVEELYANFATLTGVTGSASEVSTQLSGILGAMIKPTQGMKVAIKQLGFSSSEAMIKEKGLVGSLDALLKQTDGTTASIGKLVERKEALTAILALTGKSADVFKEKYAAMTKVVGATDVAWDAIANGINKTGFQLEQTKQRLVVTSQKLGDFLLPALAKVLDITEPLFMGLGSILKVLNSMPDTLKTVAVGIAGVTVAFTAWGPWGAAVTALAVAISLLPRNIDSVSASTTKANEQSAITFKTYSELEAQVLKYGASYKEIREAMADYTRDAEGNVRTEKERLEMVVKNIDGTKTSYAATGTLRAAIIKLTEVRKKDAVATGESTKRTDEETSKVVSIVTDAHNKYMELTLSENEFRRQQLTETYKKERETLLSNMASKTELLTLEKSYQAEISTILTDAEEERLQTRRDAHEENKTAIQVYFDEQLLLREEHEAMLDDIDQQAELMAMEGREREIEELRRQHATKKLMIQQMWKDNKINAKQAYDMLLKMNLEYNQKANTSNENMYVRWHQLMLENTKKQREAFTSSLSVFTGYLSAKQKKLDQWYENEKMAIDTSKMTEEQKQEALKTLDNEYAERKTAIARKVAVAEKAQNIALASMNVATAVTKALGASIPPFNYAMAIAVGLLGAKWIHTIATTPLPMKEGGMAQNDGLAYLHKNEVVAPFGKVQEMLAPNQSEGGGTVVNIYLSALDTQSLVEAVHDQVIPILETASDNEQFVINERAVKRNV